MSITTSPVAESEAMESSASPFGTAEKRLEDHTVKELRELASQLGIRGRSKLMHKEELVSVIRRRW